MSDYLKECDENWVISYRNLKAAERAEDVDAMDKWNAELDRIEDVTTSYIREMEL